MRQPPERRYRLMGRFGLCGPHTSHPRAAHLIPTRLEHSFDSNLQLRSLTNRVKPLVTILFSLALVLSHWVGFASPAQRLCGAASACGCGDSGCCMASADSTPAPVVPAPAPETSRGQLLAALPLAVQFMVAHRAAPASELPFPALPAPADVPLFVRHCSYLI
jgi:hypothetical protein